MDYLINKVKQLEDEIEKEQDPKIVERKTGYLESANKELSALIQAKTESEIKMAEKAHEKAYDLDLEIKKRKAEVELALLTGNKISFA